MKIDIKLALPWIVITFVIMIYAPLQGATVAEVAAKVKLLKARPASVFDARR